MEWALTMRPVQKQRVIGSDVPMRNDIGLWRKLRGFEAGTTTARLRTQVWSMPETYPGSATLSRYKILVRI
jgi:hypothetical protein